MRFAILLVAASVLWAIPAEAQTLAGRVSGEVATAGGSTLSPGGTVLTHLVWGRVFAVGPAVGFTWFPDDSDRGAPEYDHVLEKAVALTAGPLVTLRPGRLRATAYVGIGPGSASVREANDVIAGYTSPAIRADLGVGWVVAMPGDFEVAIMAHGTSHMVFWGGGLGVTVARRFDKVSAIED